MYIHIHIHRCVYLYVHIHAYTASCRALGAFGFCLKVAAVRSPGVWSGWELESPLLMEWLFPYIDFWVAFKELTLDCHTRDIE